MDHEKYTDEWIKKYLKGELSEQETRKFEEDLNANIDFAEKVAFEKHDIRGKSRLEKESWPNLKLDHDQPTYRKPFIFLGLVGAAFIVLFVILFWLITADSTYLNLYNEFFKPYPAEMYNSTTAENDQLSDALSSYKAGYYQKALQDLMEIQPKDDQVLLYTANTYLMLNDYRKAIDLLLQINGSNEVATDDWYLALAYLRRGKINKSATILQELSQSSNAYQDQSKQLLQQLTTE
ncbi:MAG: hypothetical protein ACNS62_01555 [Candidatus Cyclobacteriaceae bacterium M3_2C_046]